MNGTIFVSIASYRDPVCMITVNNMFEKAKYPFNVFVGICQQNSEEDSDCLDGLDNIYKNNIQIMRLPHYEAQGPTKARYYCSTLFTGQDYFLQIDSHTKFVKDWDMKCISMIVDLKTSGVKKPVVSHYPGSIEDADNDKLDRNNVATICKSFFHDSNGIISFEGAHNIDSKGVCRPSAYITGGMFFCDSRFLKELPFDPRLDYLFIGEEILHSVRFYTHGWDIFTPREIVLFHEYTRPDKPKIWTDSSYSTKEAEDKVKHYLTLDSSSELTEYMKKDYSKYGLGTERSLEDYYKYSGIDLNSRTVNKDFCYDDLTKENFTVKSHFKRYLIAILIIILCIFIYKYRK